MISRIRIVTVYVSDQQRSLDFFVNALGFRKQHDEEFGPGQRWIEVVPEGGRTAITLFPVAPSDPRLGGHVGLVFTCDDIEATHREMAARGVRFVEPPKSQPWGAKQALFADPDDNIFVLVDRP